MNEQESVLRRILITFVKIGVGLIAIYAILVFINVNTYSLSEVKRYSHCNTYQGFIETAQARNVTLNAVRMSDLREVGVQLVLYFDEHGEYPVITSGTSNERWNNLLNFLALSLEDKKNLSDPCIESNSDYQYSYGSNSDGTDYILRAIMSDEDMHESELRNEIYGLWCGESDNDREYCVGPLE